jgi:hypothetical protein
VTSVGTFWRTVRHLKLEQWIGRARLKLLRPAPDLRVAPGLRARMAAWIVPAAREPSLVGPARFRFLNVERNLDHCGWDDPSIEKLWRYNLHYFDDLNAQGASLRVADHCALLSRWIEENPPPEGTAWEPYPVSLRIVNWIKWFLGGATPSSTWLHSLAVQARWLRRRLETHLLGNHLLVNAKGLVFAGLWFEGAEADEWLSCGLDILGRELREQVLEDGGHFERSPMYHALAFEDVLDLLNVTACYGQGPAPKLAPLRESAAGMLYWLRCMSHPDQGLGAFNDAADGIAPHLSELERYGSELHIKAPQPPRDAVTPLSASGYVRVSRGSAVALLDVAPIGPDYMPGHAHADTLSFELSLGSQRVVVNGGTSCYGASAQRLRERGTAAHSTVQLAGENSSEVWSGFRVGRRARPLEVAINEWQVCGSHDGYRFLQGRPEHRRCWRFGAGDLIVDDVVSTPSVPAVARYILAPGLRLRGEPSGEWSVRRHDGAIAKIEVTHGRASASHASHAPRFGVVLPADCLEIAFVDGRARTRWIWQDRAHEAS